MVQSIYDPSMNAAIETGNAEPDTLKLIDGEGPGFVQTSTLEQQNETTGFDFSDDPLLVVGEAPKTAIPWWVWALIAIGVANLMKGGK
jgi:hypothetical protein